MGIMGDLARGDDANTAVNREVLKAAVMRAITCPMSGVVLDKRTAVLFSVKSSRPGGPSGSTVCDGAAWDAVAQQTRDTCAEKGFILEVIDGRVINAPRPRRTPGAAS